MSTYITPEEIREGDKLRISREITAAQAGIDSDGEVLDAEGDYSYIAEGWTVELLERPIVLPTEKGAVVKVTDRNGNDGVWLLTKRFDHSPLLWVSATHTEMSPTHFKNFLGGFNITAWEAVL